MSLDTDHTSLFQRSHPQVVERASGIPRQNLAVTIVTAEEQIRGRFKVIRRTWAASELVTAYWGLRATIEYFKNAQLLDFGQAAAVHYAALRRKIRIGTQDLRIAAIVMAAGGILVTRNHRDFSRVPDLLIEDWSR
ncbi:MAG: type II toxin-antitoxin system VapC family toxin [bacterium]|nr:type II toxin-antitoxin system VapC family toxin [bacterium]